MKTPTRATPLHFPKNPEKDKTMTDTELANIKSFPIMTLLEGMGTLPVHRSGKEFYFNSPLRQEATPSFCVDPKKNSWFDHGHGAEGKGGDIISLVQEVMGIDFKAATQLLAQVVENPNLIGVAEKPQPVAYEEREYKNTLEQVGAPANLKNQILWNYLQKERGINVKLLQTNPNYANLIKEVTYKRKGFDKVYFAIGFPSSGGYELRSRGFQSFLGKKKDISFMKGHVAGCAVFEGWMDYLSALTYFYETKGTQTLGYDVLILNTTRHVKRALPFLQSQPSLHLFLDNDSAGLNAAEFIKKECRYLEPEFSDLERKERVIKSYNHIYQGYTDFNDFLTKTAPSRPLPGTYRDTVSEYSQKARWWLWVVYRETQRTKDGKPLDHFTFYSFNNHDSGLQQLLQLRQQLQDSITYYRLCERVKGREFKILDGGRV